MRLLLFTIFITIKVVFFGQTTILSENFDEGFPTGWQLVDNDGLTPNESSAVNFIDDAFVIVEDYDSTSVGDSILVATSWFTESGTADDWLILPNLTLGSVGNTLSFDAKSVDASYPDGLEIRVSTGGVELWEFFNPDTLLYFNTIVSPYWTNYTVSLDGFGLENESVFLAIRHRGTDQYILALDNIEVSINDVSTVVEHKNEITCFPNPSNTGVFRLANCRNEKYQVFEINGKLVTSGVNNSANLDLSHLNSGVYLLKVANRQPLKLIIE